MSVEIQNHNNTVLASLEPGDAVEFNRGIYSHWALYIGNEEVIHLAGDENDGLNANFDSGHLFTVCGRHFSKAIVKRANFWDVVLDSKAKKNNSKDNRYTPSDLEDIIDRAINKIGDIGYNVLWSNCEHFVSFCRYGKEKSEQVEKLTWWAVVGMTAFAVLGITLGSTRKKEKPQTE